MAVKLDKERRRPAGWPSGVPPRAGERAGKQGEPHSREPCQKRAYVKGSTISIPAFSKSVRL